MLFRVPKKGQLRFSERKLDLTGFREMDKNALVISKRLRQVPLESLTTESLLITDAKKLSNFLPALDETDTLS